MPLFLIGLSMVLQDCVKGYLSGRIGVGGGLLFSCVSFAMAAVVFGALYGWSAPGRAARAAAARRSAAERRSVRRLLVAMNVLTAVCFLSVYTALASVPAALTNGITSALGPVVVAVAGLAGIGRRPTASTWTTALALLGTGLALAFRLSGRSSGATGAEAGAGTGLLLAFTAGISVACLAMVSGRLGALGVTAVQVMAFRFHLTYLAAAVLVALRGGPPAHWVTDVPRLALLGMLAVVLPLFLLQYGLQRSDPLLAVVVLSASPAVAYGAQLAFGEPVDPGALVLIAVLILLALVGTLHGRRQEAAAARRVRAGALGRGAPPPESGRTGHRPGGRPRRRSGPRPPAVPAGPRPGAADAPPPRV